MATSVELLDNLICDLEAKIGLLPRGTSGKAKQNKQQEPRNKTHQNKRQSEGNKKGNNSSNKKSPAASTGNLPGICKLEFKVGVIVKVWVHPDANKLYCEEIDCGEEGGPRQIASGLRMHYSEEEMLGKRVLVVANLKAKNLVGFKSHGMVLCAAQTDANGTETVEFIEPPDGAPLGEVVTFDGLPQPAPFSPSQVEKKKIFAACMDGMKTNEDCVATWNGHVFMTSAGPCRGRTIRGGAMR